MKGRVLGLALGALCACRGAGHDVELSASARHLPQAGAGFGVALEQRIAAPGGIPLAFELGFEEVPLDEQGPLGDDWRRAFAGVVLRADQRGPRAALGITWVRTDAAVQGLEAFGDYGGAYLSLGHSFALGRNVRTGPEVLGAWLDSEGDRAGSGSFVEFAWRLAFCF